MIITIYCDKRNGIWSLSQNILPCCASSVGALDEGTIPQWGRSGDSASFHHTALNGAHFKTYELFVSGNSHLVFSDHGELGNKPQKGKPRIRGEDCGKINSISNGFHI